MSLVIASLGLAVIPFQQIFKIRCATIAKKIVLQKKKTSRKVVPVVY